MSAGPLSRVLAEVAAGTPTLTQMARNLGLDEEVVRAAVEHLVRSGRIESRELSLGCPPSGCGSCAVASGGGGCGHPEVVAGRRPGLVMLSLTRSNA